MRHDFNAIVLVDENWGIGCDGKQNIYIQQDLERFKELTLDKTVIVGRKTLATFPNQAPLAKRKNLVLSTNAALRVGRAKVCTDTLSLFSTITPQESVFIVGGASVYQALLPFCNQVFVTKVKKDLPADCFFPNLDESEAWTISEESEVMEENGVEFQYVTYLRG